MGHDMLTDLRAVKKEGSVFTEVLELEELLDSAKCCLCIKHM
jgi:hypothetical protein